MLGLEQYMTEHSKPIWCWIGHILCRNCLLKQVIEGKIKGEIEVTRRRGRRCKKLLDDLKDRRGYSHLREEALDRTMWRHRFGGGFGPVVKQNTEWMNECCNIWYEDIGDDALGIENLRMSVNCIDDILKSVVICTILDSCATRYYTMARRRGSYFNLFSTNKLFLLRSETSHKSKWQFLLSCVLWFAILPSVARSSSDSFSSMKWRILGRKI